MYAWSWISRTAMRAALLLLVGSLAVSLAACGGEEEGAEEAGAAQETAEGSAPAAPAEAPADDDGPLETAEEMAEDAVEAAADLVMGGDGVLPALAWQPGRAGFTLAVPSMHYLHDNIVPLVKRFAPEGFDVEAELDSIVSDLASDAGVPDAETLMDLAEAKGIDPAAPMAVFLDLEPLAEGMAQVVEAMESAEGEGMAEPMPEDPPMPDFAVVMMMEDEETAMASIEEMVAMVPELSGAEAATVEASGLELTTYAVSDEDTYGHFMSGNALAFGNNIDMLSEVAARAESPAEFDLDAVPGVEADNVLMLVQGASYLESMMKLAALTGETDVDMAAFMTQQQEVMADMMEVADGADGTLYMALDFEENKVDLRSLVEMADFPNMEKYVGAPEPLMLAPAFPANTQLAIALQLTDEYKTMLQEQYVNAMPEELADQLPGAQAMGFVNQAFALIGNELAAGVAPIEGDFPALMIMANLANAEMARNLLTMLAQPEPLEEYKGAEIMALANVPLPIAVYLAYYADHLLVASNLDEIKGIIDRLEAGEDDVLFGSIEPAIDPATPRWSFIYLDTAIISDVVLPLAPLAAPQALSGPQGDILQSLADEVRQIRSMQDVEDGWTIGTLEVFLYPEDETAGEAEEDEDAMAGAA